MMNSESILSRLMEEMRNKGSLPAMSETVLEISRLAKKSDSSTLDLATVIMRDCGLVSNLLTTVNSAYYAPRFPIKTVSAAVTYLGFDKVYLLSLGLGLFRHTMVSLQKRKLLKLYATSYFSGILAMALAREYHHPNPEEIFIAGLLYRLPGLSLANTFPERFQEMEGLINEREMTVNQACLKVFQVSYDEICDAVLAFYHLPDDLACIIRQRKLIDDPVISLVEEATTLAAMLFGDRLDGRNTLRRIEKKIGKILNRSKFSIPELMRQTFESDGNVKHFFNLNTEDVEMMVNILQWGKANPMQVVTHMDFGPSLDDAPPVDTPEVLIGHFLTELVLCRKHGGEINKLLLLAQEALFRCLPDSEVFMAFLKTDQAPVLQGRFYVGTLPHIDAQDFTIPMNKSDSAIVQCLASLSPSRWHAGPIGLGLPYTPFGKKPFKHAYLAPLVLRNQAIGLCFTGRLKGTDFNERECVWIDQIVDQITIGFAIGKV
jgi:HD-like signal output (HDOD) protein